MKAYCIPDIQRPGIPRQIRLALKVSLPEKGSAPTLVFNEIVSRKLAGASVTQEARAAAEKLVVGDAS